MRASPLHAQRGVAAVEFGIIAVLFFTLLLGIMEMGRLLWTWNAAAEATRLGARVAVVCDVNDTTVRQRMRQVLPYLQDSHVSVEYLPGGCTASSCKTVRVTLEGYTHVPIIPFVPMSLTIPPFQTTLPREFMQSTGNPICG